MIFIDEYLRSHKKDIVDSIQSNYIPANIIGNNTFNSLATELQRKFMHDHRGHIGGRDEAHNVLTMAIICSMWCGWLSQPKINRKAYPQEWVDNFKKIIVDAFEIGQDYATERP
ncbi:MAG: hypothetical protein ACRD5B_14200 [Nitrososphaeraceae archaeon]